MKEKMKTVFIALLLTVMTGVYFWLAADHYTIVLFDTVEIVEWLFDICACGLGILFGICAITLWVSVFRGK